MSAPSAKRRRVEIPPRVKREIVERKNDHPKMTIQNLQEFVKESFALDIGRSTLSDILKEKDRWLSVTTTENGTRRKSLKHKDLEDALLLWFSNARTRKLPINDDLLLTKAKQLGDQLDIQDLQYSRGWLAKFKQRNCIKRYTVHREVASVDIDSVVDERKKLQELLKNYHPDDVYNCDETGLFYKLEPNTTLSNGPVAGKKQSKDRMSIMLMTNSTGTDKHKPLVIWRFKRPRCFGKVNSGFDPNRICHWYSNKKSWMTSVIFMDWLAFLDRQMRANGRKILLLMDNAPSHSVPTLTNVTVHFLPPNTTACLQPLDAGIIRNFKALYRRQQMRFYLECMEDDRLADLNPKFALEFMHKAWSEVTPETIKNCWNHTGIMPDDNDNSPVESNMEDLTTELQSLITMTPGCDMSAQQLVDIDMDVEVDAAMTDEEIIDSVTSTSQPNEDVEEDENDEDLPIITNKKAREGCDLMKEYMLQHPAEFSMREIDSVIKLREKLFQMMKKTEIQTNITSFFKKQ